MRTINAGNESAQGTGPGAAGSRRSPAAGFSLMELMVAIAVLGIVVSIAYPMYDDQVSKSRRTTAKSELLSLSNRLERHFARNQTYLGFDTTAYASEGGYYTISFAAGEPTATTFQVQAAPIGVQSGDKCGTMTLDQMAQITAAFDLSACW